MAITSISPRSVTRGASGDLITILGTGFGATQGAGTLSIGAQAVIVGAWGATGITCYADDSPATPLGAQDLVLTPDGGSAETWVKAISVYDDTDADDATKVEIGLVDAVYIDGTHVGKTVGGATITPGERTLPYQPDDVHTPEHELVLERFVDVNFVASQITAANIAKAMGATLLSTPVGVEWDGAFGNKSEHSILIIDGVGIKYVIPRARVVTPAPVALATEDWDGIPFAFRGFETSKAERRAYWIESPQ